MHLQYFLVIPSGRPCLGIFWVDEMDFINGFFYQRKKILKRNVLDGYAVTKAIKASYRIACITGGSDPMVKHRLNYLGITDYYSKSSYKLQNFEDFKDKYDLKNDEVLSMGDDIPDYDMLRLSAIGACPINAVPEIKKIADYISPIHGGKGCVRDVIEKVMKVQGKWTEEDDTASV